MQDKMSLSRMAWQSVWFHRWMLAPVSLGVAVATAVIVGALLVGDSVRGSLRYLATDRLGSIQSLMLAPRFFDVDVISRWIAARGHESVGYRRPIPLIAFPKATIAFTPSNESTSSSHRRSSHTMVLGVNAEFWSLGEKLVENEIKVDEIVLNEALAVELNVKLGDLLTLRLPSQSAVPADSPLGKRETETVNIPGLRVVQIVPNRSLGRFDLRSNQRASMNAFVSLQAIQQALDRPGEVNAIVFGEQDSDNKLSPYDSLDAWQSTLPVKLSDLGFSLEHVVRRFPESALGEKNPGNDAPETIFDYYQLTTEQMLIPDSIVQAILKRWPAPASSPVLTYLVNGIERIEPAGNSLSVPYSTIAAVEPSLWNASSVGFGPSNPSNQVWLSDGKVVINQWLAEQLQANVGDTLKMDYFLAETVDGSEVEKSFVATISNIVPLTQPELGYSRRRLARFKDRPTPFNDPKLTPEVPGITDQDSISDWELPFTLTRTIRDEDDEYWVDHRLTPKLFVSLDEGKKLFGSRFGSISSIRLATIIGTSEDSLRDDVLASIKPNMQDLGWQMMPLRYQQLAAAKGTTPFDMLFLSLSFFVILAALILVALLFRLAVERRASHWGVLLAMGWPLSRVKRLISMEGMFLAVIGAVLGACLGVGYALGVLALLRTWWVGAVGAPFLQFFATWPSIMIGIVAGIVTAWLAIRWVIRSFAKLPSIQLLRGKTEPALTQVKRSTPVLTGLIILGLLGTLTTTVIGVRLQGQAAGGAFVGSGMLGLLTMLLILWQRIKQPRTSASDGATVSSLPALSRSSILRRPLRSVLTTGLMSVATLLILSMSLFEISPTEQGTGGFQWLLESNVPLAKSLNDSEFLVESLGEKASIVDQCSVIPLRVRDGDDAGCNNLYQASQPRVLGVSPRMQQFDLDRSRGDSFAWAAEGEVTKEGTKASPWALLDAEANGTADAPFPAILDQNTAMWALHLTGGVGQKFTYRFDQTNIHFITVALLQNTILQGAILIGEENFKKAFPSISGYRSWLVHTSEPSHISQLGSVFENGWPDEGMNATATEEVLTNLLAVQNTYLKAFQSLGALGLLLGSLGLAVVQMRSVMERRGEIGLMQAIGFPQSRVGWLIFLESLVLLVAGLGIGCLAAAIALIPAWIRDEIQPSAILPLVMVAIVAVCGILASLLAVRQAMRTRILEAIRQG